MRQFKNKIKIIEIHVLRESKINIYKAKDQKFV